MERGSIIKLIGFYHVEAIEMNAKQIKELTDQVEALEEFLLQDVKPPQL